MSQNVHTVGMTVSVNGVDRDLLLDARVTLLDALRDALGLTGTKKGCDQGACGAYPNIVAAIREVAQAGGQR